MAGFSREVARRIFAEELRNSTLAFRDGDDQHQYAPQYLLTPTGARCNRVFLVGTLTERDDIGGDTEYWRGRVIDPTGSILVYAGQYQPEAAQALANIEPPAFVAVVGKPNLYQTEDGSVIISVRVEAIQKVDEATRNRWIIDTAKRTKERLDILRNASIASPEFSTADKSISILPAMDIERALAHYNTDVKQYMQMVIRALSALKIDISHEPARPPKMEEVLEVEVSKAPEPELSKTKTESSRKTKSKASKGATLDDLRDSVENGDVGIVDLRKKS
jgi:RPA family protein